MKIAIVFGHMAPKDGNGLVELGDSLMLFGHEVVYFRCNDDIAEPFDAYIGHSFGGDKCVETILKFPDRKVEYLGLIDPVKKGWFPFFWLPAVYFKVPGNVARADCFKRTGGWLPPSSSIRNPKEIDWVNHSIPSGHGNAPRNEYARSVIRKRLLK